MCSKPLGVSQFHPSWMMLSLGIAKMARSQEPGKRDDRLARVREVTTETPAECCTVESRRLISLACRGSQRR